jgi:hypothetical protein
MMLTGVLSEMMIKIPILRGFHMVQYDYCNLWVTISRVLDHDA